MALQLNITLPNGAEGNYIRVVNVEWNRLASVCVFQLALYLSEAQADAAPRYPLGIIAQVRVDREKFEDYLSNHAIAAASHNIIAQLYAITRAEPGCITLLGSLRDIDLTTAIDV